MNVTYTIELNKDNAELIDKINRLILKKDYVEIADEIEKEVEALIPEKKTKKRVTKKVAIKEEIEEDDQTENIEEIDFEEVRTRLRAMAKDGKRDEAKQIMTDNKVDRLSKVKDATQEQLRSMLEALKEHI